jgi:hypothetical protein
VNSANAAGRVSCNSRTHEEPNGRNPGDGVIGSRGDPMTGLALTELHDLPAGLLDVPATRLRERLAGPTLIHLPGRRTPPLFVAVLLHGDETNGWDALRVLLRRHPLPLPRALSLLIGNVAAAALGVRRLPHQTDYARIWQDRAAPEHPIAAAVVEAMRRRGLLAVVDIHDHRGPSPPFAVVADTKPATLGLARAFGPLAVLNHPLRPLAQVAFGDLAPAVTIECGDVRDAHGSERALHFLERRLTEADLPRATPYALQLFVADARVRVAPDCGFSFGAGPGLQLRDDLGPFSFRRLAAGTLFARQRSDALGLVAEDTQGADVTSNYFERIGADVRLTQEVFPAFCTTDLERVREDALCYFMHPHVTPYRKRPASNGV